MADFLPGEATPKVKLAMEAWSSAELKLINKGDYVPENEDHKDRTWKLGPLAYFFRKQRRKLVKFNI